MYYSHHGPLTRYVKLRLCMRRECRERFPPTSTLKEIASYRSRYESWHVRHARAVMKVGIANPRWRGKPSWHSWRIHNPQVYVSGKRPMLSSRYAQPRDWISQLTNKGVLPIPNICIDICLQTTYISIYDIMYIKKQIHSEFTSHHAFYRRPGRFPIPDLGGVIGLGAVSIKIRLVGGGIPITKIRQPHDHLIFIMEIPIP